MEHKNIVITILCATIFGVAYLGILNNRSCNSDLEFELLKNNINYNCITDRGCELRIDEVE